MSSMDKTRSSFEGMLSRGETTADGPGTRVAADRVPLAAGWQSLFGIGLAAADLAALAMAVLTFAVEWAGPLRWLGLAAGLSAMFLAHCVARAMGLYSIGDLAMLRRGPGLLLAIGLPSTIALMAIALALHVPGAGLLGAIGLAALLAMLALRLGAAAWATRHITRLAERVVLIGTCPAIDQLLRPGLIDPADPRLAGWIAVGGESASGAGPAPPPLGHLDVLLGSGAGEAAPMIDRLVAAERAERLVIVSGGLDQATILGTLRQLEHLPYEIGLFPSGAELGALGDPLDRDLRLVLRRASMTPVGRIAKRSLDLVAACALLLFLSPVLLGIALLIRLDSPGPVLFRQARGGYCNVPFSVLKFRTMWADAPATDGSVQATRNDPRVTRVGAFLRRTSLDELPQLLNVLNGTMSLVGPRPHPLDLDLRFNEIIDRYAGRHRVLPGITGLAQVRGFRGETRSPHSMRSRVACDLEYVRTRSFVGDMVLLLRTCISLVRGHNAY
jgi:exopolysaccharide biosynthesis polyprenyl glycosylphosphotransferase